MIEMGSLESPNLNESKLLLTSSCESEFHMAMDLVATVERYPVPINGKEIRSECDPRRTRCREL